MGDLRLQVFQLVVSLNLGFTGAVDQQLLIKRQTSQHRNLIKRSKVVDESQAFLLFYDATLRIVEIMLIFSGGSLNETPHLVLREVVTRVASDTSISDLIKLRHKVKKFGGRVTRFQLNQMMELEKITRVSLASEFGITLLNP